MPSSPNRPDIQLPRLYAILDVATIAARGREPAEVLDAWLQAGVRLVQLRAKNASLGAMLALAEPFLEACRASGAMFIVNDRADVARLAGAHGVHVGQDDLSPQDALGVYPDARVIGYSTHTLDQLRDGLGTPATYLAFGPVFETSSKARPDPVVGLHGLADAVRLAAGSPVVAIGGITLERAPAAIAAGAASVAVIADLLVDDPGRRARAYLRALT